MGEQNRPNLFLRIYSRVSYGAGIAASACIFLMVCTIVPDSIGRYFFNKPLHGTLELNMLLMSAIVFLSLSWTQSQRGHVRVELLLSNVGPRWRSALNIFSWMLALVLLLLFTIGGAEEAIYSTKTGENLWGVAKFPVWPGKIIAAFGSALICIQLFIDIVQEIKKLLCHPLGENSNSNRNRES
jgi:TRAP-type C4-dicarboxylate transport system permease small subunit